MKSKKFHAVLKKDRLQTQPPAMRRQASIMEKAKPRFRLLRGIAAAAIVFLFLAILIPNLWSFAELVFYIGVLLVPLACIHFGADRFRFLEIIGWCLLALLLLLAMSA